MTVTFGVEEEFFLLNPRDLATVNRGADAVASISSLVPGVTTREFFRSQVEYATPVCSTADDVLSSVSLFRRRLAEWASQKHLVVAASGSAPRIGADAEVTDDRRYRDIADDIAFLVGDHQFGGLHVHVGIDDRDEAVAASNRIRRWLPTLAALSGNSPLWRGSDTGYSSWRLLHNRRWTTHGIPPMFRDAADHDVIVDSLLGLGTTRDENTVNWGVRLSHRYPTVEIRVCDVQLDPVSTAALAAIVRALVLQPGRDDDAAVPHAIWDAGLWHAARHGLSHGVLHPADGRLHTADEVISALERQIHPMLDESDMDVVDEFFWRLPVRGIGSVRQRDAARRGSEALRILYEDALVAS